MEFANGRVGDVMTAVNGVPYLSIVSQDELNRIRKTYEWRKLSAQVREEEPICRLWLPGCTRISTCADHIIPASRRPDLFLVRSNLQGACDSCNNKRGDKPLEFVTTPRALGFFDTTREEGSP